MDSKNPMRAGVLELGEQIKREHSEGKKKIVKKNMKRF